MRILHTADIHLGARFLSLGSKGQEHRRQLLRTFERVANLAISERVDLFVIAGDLFDSNNPPPFLVEETLRILEEVIQAGVATCLLPGTHDPPGPRSVYSSFDFAGRCPGLCILADSSAVVHLPQFNTAVYGLQVRSGTGSSPLADLQLEEADLHIAVAHCSFHIPDRVEGDAMMVRREEVASSGLNYLALGHWHSYAEYPCGPTLACYSGAPEVIDVDQGGAGRVALVEIDDKGNASATPVQVGTRRFERVRMPLDAASSAAEVRNAIAAKADGRLILEVVLEGLQSFDLALDVEELERTLEEAFFRLKISNRSHPVLEDVELRSFPSETVLGRFVRLMRHRIASAPAEEVAVHEEALRLGVALLQGKEVLR